MEHPQISIDEFFFGPGSAVQFSDDQVGVEVRLLLAGYGERLTDMVKQHRPIHEIRETVKRINRVLRVGVDHLLDQALEADRSKPAN
jgi:hypothetical protein